MASVSLFLVFPNPSLPFLRGLAPSASPASRGGSGLPLTPPSFLRQRPRCRRFTWMCGARPRSWSGSRALLPAVVDDYSRYTTVFPLRSKGDVTEVLIDWIRAARLQLRQSFGSDFLLCVCTLTEGESSPLAFCEPSFLHEASARPSRFRTLHSKIGLLSAALAWSWTSPGLQAGDLPSPTVDGKVGDAFASGVWGSRAFVRDLSADKLSLVLLLASSWVPP
ncbi:unnamed protein product [Closterium sp. NIES-64]|nr:unnamed protein product [Closterium sp. NIES-64]